MLDTSILLESENNLAMFYLIYKRNYFSIKIIMMNTVTTWQALGAQLKRLHGYVHRSAPQQERTLDENTGLGKSQLTR